MPYYNSSDPQGMQQASGNPWYNPLSPYTNLGGGIQYLLAQMAGQKEQKKQAEWDIEDRDLKKRLVEAQIGNYGETTTKNPTSMQERIDLYTNNPDLYNRMFPPPSGPKTPQQIEDEAAARARGTHSVTGSPIDESQRKDAVDARKTALAEAKERKKKYDSMKIELGATEKQINSTKLKIASASNKGDTSSVAALNQAMVELQLKKEILDKTLQEIADSFRPSGQAGANPQETKLIGGTTYYKWSDGKWYPNKEGLQTKK